MAIPNLVHWVAVYRVKVVAQDVRFAVHYARVLAYSQKESYGLSSFPGETTWSKGMQLFKIDGVGHQIMVQSWRWAANQVTVTWKGIQGSQRLVFAAYPTHAMCNGHFLITAGRLKTKLVVNRLGRLIEETKHD